MSPRREVVGRRAAEVVAKRLGVQFQTNDTGVRQRQYDFRLSYPDGRLAALEVTEHADEDLMRLLGAMDKHGSEFPAPTLVRDWYLYLEDCSVRYKKVSEEIVATASSFLARLEGDGIAFFYNDHFRPACPVLRDLGICFGIASSEPNPIGGSMTVMMPGSGGAIGPELVADAALEEAAKGDNLAKLGEAGLEERQLFVWVSKMLPLISFGRGMPTQPVILPDEITYLWVGGQKEGTIHVWTVENGGRWTAFTVPEE